MPHGRAKASTAQTVPPPQILAIMIIAIARRHKKPGKISFFLITFNFYKFFLLR